MSGTTADPEAKPNDTRWRPPRLIMILRGAGFRDVSKLGPGLFEAWKGEEEYIVHETGDVLAGGELSSGLQSFLDEYYVPNEDSERS